jgi:Homeodomain-like domain
MAVEAERNGQCDVTVAAIAEEFGCSPRTIWRQLSRARAERDDVTKLFAQISPEMQAKWDAAIASVANWLVEYERAQQDDCGGPGPKS